MEGKKETELEKHVVRDLEESEPCHAVICCTLLMNVSIVLMNKILSGLVHVKYRTTYVMLAREREREKKLFNVKIMHFLPLPKSGMKKNRYFDN